MGYAIAAAAQRAGHTVTLVSGPVALPPVSGVEMVNVESAAEMAQAVHKHAPQADMIIMAAAVADYRPAKLHDEKMKKSPGNIFLELERTEDILASLGQNKRPGQILVGFAAETSNLEASALGKMQRKNLDWIAANLVSDGFDTETNRLILLSAAGERIELPTDRKEVIAAELLKNVTRA